MGGSNHQWSVSTLFYQGHQSVTLQPAPHVPLPTRTHVGSLSISASASKPLRLSLRFENICLIIIHSQRRSQVDDPQRDGSFRCAARLVFWDLFSLPALFFSDRKHARQPVWNWKTTRQGQVELRVRNEVVVFRFFFLLRNNKHVKWILFPHEMKLLIVLELFWIWYKNGSGWETEQKKKFSLI